MTRSNNEIPVRRRSGVPWWAWLIGLALLALLAWALLNNMGNRNNAGGGASSPAASQSAPAGSTDAGTSPDASDSPDASGGTDASGSPASSWIGTDGLTVALPARTIAA